MSLLKHLAPSLRVTRRPCLTALSSTSAPPYADEMDFLSIKHEMHDPPSTIDDLGPPVASLTAYPRAVNPVSLVKQEASAAAATKRLASPHAIYVKATHTNTIVTVTRPGGNPIQTVTGGKVGFKGGNRSGFEAGYKCAVEAFRILNTAMGETGSKSWHLYLNGFGNGRDAVNKALMAGEGQEVKPHLHRIIDKTPIKVGGTRAKKMKRR